MHKKLTTIVNELIMGTIRDSEKDNAKITFGPKFDNHASEKLDQLTQNQIELTKAKLMKLQQLPALVQTDRIEDRRDKPTSYEEWYCSYLAQPDATSAKKAQIQFNDRAYCLRKSSTSLSMLENCIGLVNIHHS